MRSVGRWRWGLIVAAALALGSWVVGEAGSAEPQQAEAAPELEPAAPESPDEFVAKRCGTSCHEVPDPTMLSKDQWSKAIELMKGVMLEFGGVEYSSLEMQQILIYYRSRSLQRLPKLPPDPGPSRIRFAPEPIGLGPSVDRRSRRWR